MDFGIKLGTRSDEGRQEFQRYFESAITYDGKESNEIASIAAEHKLFVVVGVVERDAHTLYCSVILKFVLLKLYFRSFFMAQMEKKLENTESSCQRL